MQWRELIIDGYGRVLRVLERALDGLTQDDLNQQPNPDCNSMGWLTWHLTRVQDRTMMTLAGKHELWVKDEWYARFNHPPDLKDIGVRHTSEDVARFKSPDVITLLDYHRAVLEQTKEYINSLSETDLDREISGPMPTLGARLVGTLSDNLQHAGQVAYLRGLLKGKGWSNI